MIRIMLLLLSVAGLLNSAVSSAQVGSEGRVVASQRAISDLLARELPLAVENHKMAHLAPYFDPNVELIANVPNASFEGTKSVFLSYEWNPLKTSPIVGKVIATSGTIVLVMNIPIDGVSPRGDLAPRVDTFHLNDEGKVVRIEVVIADRVLHRDRAEK